MKVDKRALRRAKLNTHYESYCMAMAEFIPSAATFVPGVGDPLSKVVFVGEAPGETEDRMGKPFIGKSGNLLTKVIKHAGLTRDEVFITNLIKHRPPGNADPDPTQASAARVLMRWELLILKPIVVVCLGRFATELFYPTPAISGLAGTLRAKSIDRSPNGLPVFVLPMYHPAAALRSSAIRYKMFEHIEVLKEVL